MRKTADWKRISKLRDRFDRACELQQQVDKTVITTELLEWARLMGAPADTSVVYISTEVELTRDVFALSSSTGVGQAVDRAMSGEGVKAAYGTAKDNIWARNANDVPKEYHSLRQAAPKLPQNVGR